MAGTVNGATSSLASELLLNKIMNGQVKTSTGKTVSAAGRAISSRLGSDAYSARAAESNMAYGEGLASSAQNEVSSIKDQLLKTKQNLLGVLANTAATSADFATVASAAQGVFKNLSATVAGAKYNGQRLLGNTAISLNAGNGMKMDVPAVKGASIMTPVRVALFATAANATTANASLTAINTAIDNLIKQEAMLSDSVKALQNRQLLLADQGANLDNAAASQSLADMGGASNLLSSMLGETNA